MTRKPARGLFITGTDTEVGKTYVAALIARALVDAGHRVGVYKPAASGCRVEGSGLVSEDALALWEAAGRPGTLDEVCPQRFAAPLAPHLAAEAEGRRLDAELLRAGLDPWLERSDLVVVEGAGGFMSPLGEDEFVADLACDFGFPLIVVARNALGTINHVLQTLIAAATFRDGIPVAGIVLNRVSQVADESVRANAREIRTRAVAPLLAELEYGARAFTAGVDWFALATATDSA
ncbi:MAG TPA: dethiobiotin synthase [Pirellulales bacterium]|jgi:dethiobiotin synthetase|nr:dethiobiotin synthase [Pirellulales bacterium]